MGYSKFIGYKSLYFLDYEEVMKKTVFFLLYFVFIAISCNKAKKAAAPPEFRTSMPGNDAVNVALSTNIVIKFDEVVTLASPHNITVNNIEVVVSNLLTEIFIDLDLEADQFYEIIIPAGSVINTFGVALAESVVIRFSTRKSFNELNLEPIVSNPSSQVLNLYNFLLEQYGKSSISGVCTNVSWNINEAIWVYQHTGKYPALNGFDLIHLFASPDGWVNYEDISVIEDWWNNNGIVHLMWHWNVPVEKDSEEYAFYSSSTSFDIREAIKEGTWENEIIRSDLEKAANIIEKLRDNGIPVIWRPLHEASGRWFWWGTKGAEPFKALWHIMFDYFEFRELNNLIWVWTSQSEDENWYPGDNYVDMIGRDIYNEPIPLSLANEFETTQENYPKKLIALSECGNVAPLSQQLTEGATWSFFMPWYDFSRTRNVLSPDFESKDHEYASAEWWKQTFSSPLVITRENMPDLK